MFCMDTIIAREPATRIMRRPPRFCCCWASRARSVVGHNQTRTKPPSMASGSDANVTNGEPGIGVAKKTWDARPALHGAVHGRAPLLLLALVLATYANSFAGGFWGASGAIVREVRRVD